VSRAGRESANPYHARMHMYKFIKEPNDQSDVRLELHMPSQEANLQEMLENFEAFLKACGFQFPDGHYLDINSHE
jgi:hypothetical protein